MDGEEDSSRLATTLTQIFGVSFLGALVLGLVDCSYRGYVATEANGRAIDVYQAFALGWKQGIVWGGSLGFLLAFLSRMVSITRTDGVGSAVIATLELLFLALGLLFARAGFSGELPIVPDLYRSGSPLATLALLVVGAIALSAIAAVMPAPVLRAVFFIPEQAFAPAKVLLVYGTGFGGTVVSCFSLAVMIALPIEGSHRMDDLCFASDQLVRLAFWITAGLAVTGALLAFVQALVTKTFRALIPSSLVCMLALGSFVSGKHGYAVASRRVAWRGTATVHSNQRACSTSGTYYLRLATRSATDLSSIQCMGCTCEGPVSLLAEPGETLVATIRSGDVILTEDVEVRQVLPREGAVTITLSNRLVQGTLRLASGPLWERAPERPSAHRSRAALPGTVSARVHVDRAHNVIFPTIRVRLTSPRQESEQECQTTYGNPDCSATLHDGALRIGEQIRVLVERANCLIACTLIDRNYEVRGADVARELRTDRAMTTNVNIVVGEGGPAAFEQSNETTTPQVQHTESNSLAIASVRVSSAHAGNPAEHAVDGRTDTAWNSRTGDLQGAWIELRFARPTDVRRLGVVPGFAAHSTRYGDLFTANHRIEQATITGSDGRRRTVQFAPNTRVMQFVEAGSGPIEWLRLTVVSVVPGTRSEWREVCISDLRAFGF